MESTPRAEERGVTPEEYTICTLAPDRWEEYRAVRLRALQLEPQAFGSTYARNVDRPEAEWRARLEASQISARETLLFAVTPRGKPFGIIGAFSEPDGSVSLISMYVDPEWRGRGVATALVRELLDRLWADGVSRVALQVGSTQTAAMSLYRSFGFVAVGKEEFVTASGESKTEINMELLGSPSGFMPGSLAGSGAAQPSENG